MRGRVGLEFRLDPTRNTQETRTRYGPVLV